MGKLRESSTKAFGSSQEMCLVILGQAKKRKRKKGKGKKKKRNIRKIKQGKETEREGGTERKEAMRCAESSS